MQQKHDKAKEAFAVHFDERCGSCGTMVTQCKCMAPHEVRIVDASKCPTCRTADNVVHNVISAVHRIDLAWVESLRKDFLTLMKNLPKVKDYETATRLKEAFKTFRGHFDELIFKTFLDKEVKFNLGLSESDARYIEQKLRASAWTFAIELTHIPISRAGKYDTEESAFFKFERDLPKWEARMRRAAQAFWKDLKEVITWFERYSGKALDVKTPTVEKAVLEGFQVVMRGYEDSDEHHREGLEALKEGLRIFRKRAAATAPILLKKIVPLQMEFKTVLDHGGEYDQGTRTITFYVSSIISKGPFWVAHAIAHEMGHHLWHTVLSNETQEFWVQTIKGDYGDLDVAELLANWPEGAWAFDMSRYLGDKDPTLALQAEAVSQEYDYNTKEDFERLLQQGTRALRTPKTPITGYANKNPEEAFCEAIGILVAYGAQAVHERVRAWLHTAMPGEVKIASDTARRLVDRFLFASKIDWAPSEPAMHEFEVPVGSTYEATVFLDVPGEYDRQRKARAGGYAEIDEYLFTEIETNGEHLLEQNLKSNIERRIGKRIDWTERAWGARRHTKHFRVV